MFKQISQADMYFIWLCCFVLAAAKVVLSREGYSLALNNVFFVIILKNEKLYLPHFILNEYAMLGT